MTSDGWIAWLNLEPDGPPAFYVVGTIELPSPGYEATLAVADDGPPLELALRIVAKPGTWPRQLTRVEVRYADEDTTYDHGWVIVLEPDGDRFELEVTEAE